MKQYLAEKITHTSNITLLEKNVIILNGKLVTENFSIFYKNGVKTLNINGYESSVSAIKGPVEKAAEKFKYHASISSSFFIKKTENSTLLRSQSIFSSKIKIRQKKRKCFYIHIFIISP